MEYKTFEIKLVKYEDGKKRAYKMQVEVIHRSEQVIRFRIFAGTKSMLMEKLLLKHKGQWKIRDMNFKMTGNPKEIAMTIMAMQDQIENNLPGRSQRVNKYKNK